jgi:mono/diheme cytochrome c family protein
MRHVKLICLQTLVMSALVTSLWSQEPAGGGSTSSGNDPVSAAAIAGAKQDPAAYERGNKVFAQSCAGCHGVTAKGGPGAPDLIHSLLVLNDEKGELIAPVIRDGRPDKGMPKLGLAEPQISDLVAWLHVRTYSAGHRVTYNFGNVVTGDAKKGEAYFNTTGKCSTCHSASKDLAGIGRKYDPLTLQSRWLDPRDSRARNKTAAAGKSSPSVTVTLPSGQSFSGKLDRIDDFTVSLRDSSGVFHSFNREDPAVKVELQDPLKAHTDMLRIYTDSDIHNVTAFLVTLK